MEKSETLTFRMSPGERAKLRILAKYYDKTEAECLRHIVNIVFDALVEMEDQKSQPTPEKAAED